MISKICSLNSVDGKHELPFISSRELERQARVKRMLSGKLRKHVKPASELQFDYAEATAIAKASNEKAQQAQ